MSFSVTGKSPQAVVSQWMGQLGQAAGTEAGKAAGELLGQILKSAFEGEGKGPSLQGLRLDQRFRSPVQQFGTQLQALGVSAQTVGEVLNALGKVLSNRRTLKNVRKLKHEGTEAAQEASELLETLLRAADDARTTQYHRRG